MAREINQKEQFTDKLVKFIPTEIIAAYLTLATFLGFFGPDAHKILKDSTQARLIQFVFISLLILTPVYLWKVSNVKHKLQLLIATVSFGVWAYTLCGPFHKNVWGGYNESVSVVLLVIWSLIPPLLVKGAEPHTIPLPEQKTNSKFLRFRQWLNKLQQIRKLSD